MTLKIKVGDLVRFKYESSSWGGHGVVMHTKKQIEDGREVVKVRWFDDFQQEPIDWTYIEQLEIISANR